MCFTHSSHFNSVANMQRNPLMCSQPEKLQRLKNNAKTKTNQKSDTPLCPLPRQRPSTPTDTAPSQSQASGRQAWRVTRGSRTQRKGCHPGPCSTWSSCLAGPADHTPAHSATAPAGLRRPSPPSNLPAAGPVPGSPGRPPLLPSFFRRKTAVQALTEAFPRCGESGGGPGTSVRRGRRLLPRSRRPRSPRGR